MSEDRTQDEPRGVMRREVSRRSFLTDELKRASADAVRQLPGLGGALGFVFRESEAQRDERLAGNLWLLLMGRKPKPEEGAAGLELLRNAKSADEKADALVDILWALTQTRDFEELERPHAMIIRGLYRIGLDREPTGEERRAALELLDEALAGARRAAQESQESEEGPPVKVEDALAAAKTAALEGLFTGLLRSAESVLRKSAAPAGRRRFFG
jgi:hypothetical protein